MNTCELVNVGHTGEKYVHKCKNCRREYRSRYADPTMLKANCIAIPVQPSVPNVPGKILQAIEPAAQSHGMLLGDAIAAMTAAIGIPACGGCGN